MQVTQEKDHITHAVIGGGPAINFEISNNAAFFNILSSSLYKDQILAVVRETLCNAWDAHIEGGCTHIPLEVTMDDGRFVIRDFGTGIHRDDMGQIYGTYGNSTKKNDGQQTGGFGLGCKAPFAYTDHFEVISNHDGVKTIYNMSKSSAQAQGKPGIVTIASFPTKDTGLQVTINVRAGDAHRFRELIQRVVRNGDMNVNLNGNKVSTLGFDISKSNYLLTRVQDLYEDKDTIAVRYGNVIYPVPPHAELGHERKVIENHIANMVGRMNVKYTLVFQAQPHSISVTPSRESLSMQEHTVKALKKLMTDYLSLLNRELETECIVHAEQKVRQAVQSKNVEALLSRELCYPETKNHDYMGSSLPMQLASLSEMAKVHTSCNYPKQGKGRIRDISHRILQMGGAGLLNLGLAQKYVQLLNAHPRKRQISWFAKNMVAPLVLRMQKAKVNPARLYVYDKMETSSRGHVHTAAKQPLCPAMNAHFSVPTDILPHFRNIVVLSSVRADLYTRVRSKFNGKKLGLYDGFFFYNLSLKKADRENEIAFFEQSGMTVVNIQEETVEITYDRAVKAKIAKPAAKKYKKGIPLLKSILTANGTGVYTHNLTSEKAERTETPEFIFHASLRAGVSDQRIGYFSGHGSVTVIKLFGDKGSITNNRAVYDKAIEKGAVPFAKYVEDKVIAYIKGNPRFIQYFAFDVDTVINKQEKLSSHGEYILQAIYATPDIAKKYGIQDVLTFEDRLYLTLWEEIAKHYYSNSPEVTALKREIHAIPVDPRIEAICELLIANPCLELFNSHYFLSIMNSKNKDANTLAKKHKAQEILNLLLN